MVHVQSIITILNLLGTFSEHGLQLGCPLIAHSGLIPAVPSWNISKANVKLWVPLKH